MPLDLNRLGGDLRRAARLMVGIPDYDAYVAHRLANHPAEPVMTYEEFFRVCQDRRYASGGPPRCC